MPPMNFSFDEMAQVFAQQQPALWQVCQPRVYPEVKGYPDARIPGLAYASSTCALSAAGGGLNAPKAIQDVAAVAAQCARFEFPCFFVRPSLLASVLSHDLPAELTWPALSLPFAGATFLLPENHWRHPAAGSIAFVAFARFRAGEVARLPASGAPLITTANGAFFAVAGTADATAWSGTLDHHDPLVTNPRLGIGTSSLPTESTTNWESNLLSPTETEFVASLIHLCVGLALVLDGQPALHTSVEQTPSFGDEVDARITPARFLG